MKNKSINTSVNQAIQNILILYELEISVTNNNPHYIANMKVATRTKFQLSMVLDRNMANKLFGERDKLNPYSSLFIE